MSKSFDKILVRRIREVFDNNREPVDPDAWADMEKRLNARRNMRVVYIRRIAGAAAILLLLFLVFSPFDQEEPSPGDGGSISSSRQTVPSAQVIPDTSGETKSPDQEESLAEAVPQKKEVIEPATDSQKEQQVEQSVGVAPKASDFTEDIFISGRNNIHMNKLAALDAGIEQPERRPAGAQKTTFENELWPVDPVKAGTTSHDAWNDLASAQPLDREKGNMNLSVEISTLYNYSSSMLESQVNFAGGIV